MAEVQLSNEEMDAVLAFFRDLEEDHGREKAVAKILVFTPDPDRVRQLERRARERSSDADRIDNMFEDRQRLGFEGRRWLDVADALAVLADKAEQKQRDGHA